MFCDCSCGFVVAAVVDCAAEATAATGALNSQRTPRTCWGCRTRRFRRPGWSSLRCWQYQRTCLLAYHLPALVRSEDLLLVWRGLFEGRIAISWTVDFLMVLGGPTSTALASNERFTNANFFTKLRLSTLWELLLLDLRLTTLLYHAQQLWIVFVLWARMLRAAQTYKVKGFADSKHITSVRVMHCGRKSGMQKFIR